MLKAMWNTIVDGVDREEGRYSQNAETNRWNEKQDEWMLNECKG